MARSVIQRTNIIDNMEQTQIYRQTLIDAADAFKEIARDISGLGGKLVSVYQANSVAHKADLEMHVILKALGKENKETRQAKRAAILKEKDDIERMAIDLVRETLNERPDKKITLVELDEDEEVVGGDEYGIHCSGFSYWSDTDETHAIVTEAELVDGSIRVTIKPDYGCVQTDWYDYLLVDHVAFMDGVMKRVSG